MNPVCRALVALHAPLFLVTMACRSDPGELAPVSFRVVGPPDFAGGACPPNGAGAAPLAFPIFAPDRVRVTYLAPRSSPPAPPVSARERLLCDMVFDYDAPDPAPIIEVPATGSVDIAVEFFAPDDQLLATGWVAGAELGAGTIDIPALRAGEFSCAGDRLAIGRAFHSATALPDGRVLVVGGGVADPGGGSLEVATGLYGTSSVEIFDPRTRSFSEVSVPGLTPRALHQARVHEVADDGTVTVLLSGGVTVADAFTPLLIPNAGDMLWPPSADATGAPAELLRISPDGAVEVVATPVAPPKPLAAIAQVTADRFVRVGGEQVVVDPMTMAESIVPVARFSIIDSAGWTDVAADLPLLAGRRGASVTGISDGVALVWGGHTSTAPAQQQSLAGELLIGLGQGGLPEARLVPMVGDAPTPRARHQAVFTGSEVLVVGGFDISDGSTHVPASPLVERLTIVGQSAQVEAVTGAAGIAPTPASFAGAAGFGQGDVLVTGGNPPIAYEDCAVGQGGILCSLTDAYVHRQGSGQLEPLANELLVGRYGHQMTTLADGRVLITGGLFAPAPSTVLRVVADVEIVDPRRPGEDALAPSFERAPGATADPCAVIETAALAR